MRTSGAQTGLEEGRAHYENGEYAEAFEGLNRYVRIYRDNPEAWHMLAEARRRVPLENARHLAVAANFARNALAADPTHTPSYELLLEIYPQIGQFLEASSVAESLLAQQPGHVEALWTLIQSEAVVGNHDSALEHTQEMMERAPDDMRPRRALLELMGLMGSDIDQILAQSAQLVADDPENIQLSLLHIDLLYRFGRDDQAEGILQDAMSLTIEDPEALSQMVSLLDQRGKREEAERIISDAIENPTTEQASWGMQLERLWKQGRLDDARQLMEDHPVDLTSANDAMLGWSAIVSHSNEDASNNAIVEQLMGRSSEGARFWRDAIHAYGLMQDAQWAEAYRMLETLSPIVSESDRELLEFWYGVCLHSMGEGARAVEAFRVATSLDPTWDQPAINLTRALLDLGSVSEAFQIVRQRLRFAEHPDRDLVTALVATSMVETGVMSNEDAQQIAGILEQNLRDDDPNGTVRALLARIYLAMGQAERGEALIDDIIENTRRLDTDSTIALHTAMRNAGLSTQALSQMSASMNPTNADAVYLMAMESANAGRQDEAKSLFRDALASNDSVGMRRAHAAFLDRTQDPDAADAFRALGDEFPDSPQTQQDVLESGVAWLDEQLVRDAINRLQEITGDDGVVWRLYDARRLLVFHRDPENASNASLILRGLLRDNEQYTPALVLMADAMSVLGNLSDELAYLERVVLSQPERASHYPSLIRKLQQAGRLDESERWLRDFLQLSNLTNEQVRIRVDLLIAQGLWGAALPELRVLAQAGMPNDLIRLAQAHIRRGETQEAERVFQLVLDSPDASTSHWRAAADFYASEGNTQRGLDTIALAPVDAAYQRNQMRATFYENLLMMEEAASEYRLASEGDPTGVSWREEIGFHIRSRDIDRARAALQLATARHPENEALTTFTTLLGGENQSLSSDQVTELAESLGSNVNPEAVRELLEAVGLYRESNGSEESIAGLRSLVERYPWFYTAWNTWISALVSSQTPDALERAADASRRAMSALPNDPRVASLAYEVFMRGGLSSEAASAAREWKLRSPSAAMTADIALAGALQQEHSYTNALSALEPWASVIIEDTESQPDRFAMYVTLLVQSGEIERAESHLLPLANDDVRWARTMLQIARALPLEQEPRQRWFEFLRQHLSGPVDAAQLTAYAHETATQLGSWWYERVLELTPQLAGEDSLRFHALRFSAAANDGLGREDEAITLYEQAISLQPDEPLSRNNLAYLLFKTGGDLEEASAHARHALSLLPPSRNENVRDTLGEILLALGNNEEALDVYSQGLQEHPGSLRMQLGLAQVAIATGDTQAARAYLRTIRDSGGFDPESSFQARFDTSMSAIGGLQ
jgi:tetratricopeptide (TPR) repeat protein